MKNCEIWGYPWLWLGLIFSSSLISCNVIQRLKSVDVQQNTAGTDATKNTFELVVSVAAFQADFPIFGYMKPLVVQPNEVNGDIGEVFTGYYRLVLRYRFRNMDDLLQAEQELMATGNVTRISVREMRL
jgi:hypothetical protein